MTDDQRLKILNDAAGFNTQNGIMLTKWENGFGALRVKLTERHVNPMQLVHGGLYSSMLDVALAMTGSYRPAPDPLIPGLTLSLTTDFLPQPPWMISICLLKHAAPVAVNQYFLRTARCVPYPGVSLPRATACSNLVGFQNRHRKMRFNNA